MLDLDRLQPSMLQPSPVSLPRAIFPPAGATVTTTDTFFLDASEVDFLARR